MSKLRTLSGKEVVSILQSFGFSVVGQKGTHMKLRRFVDGTKQTLTVPWHGETDKGTLRAIYRQAIRYIPESNLKGHFYSE